MLKEISVVIPTFNCAKYLGSAIDSVLKQTLCPKEIIIVDDGSTDGTALLVGDVIQAKGDLVRYFYKPNGGLSSARNFGIKKSCGNYLAFLDADDLWHPQKLELQIKKFENAHENLGVVYCDFNLIDTIGQKINSSQATYIDESCRGHIFNKLLHGNFVASSGSGVLIKRVCFENAGLFDEDLHAAEDWDMWLRISQKYDFDFVFQVLVSIRRHDGNMQNDIRRMIRNEVHLFGKWAPSLTSEQIPRSWAGSIADFVINGLPSMDSLRFVMGIMPERAEELIFHRGRGSLKIYVVLRMLLHSFRAFKAAARHSLYIFHFLGWSIIWLFRVALYSVSLVFLKK